MAPTTDRAPVRIALSGPPGAGKSTFLAALARELGRGRLAGLDWRADPVAPDAALTEAVARLDEGYPARVRAPVRLAGTLGVPALAGPPGSAGGALEVVLQIIDAPDEPGVADTGGAEPVDGWLALVPARGADPGEPAPPPDWERAPGAPLALGVAQADRLEQGELPGAHLARAWPDWLARARGRTAPCFQFGVSAYGRPHPEDAARPAPDAAPIGLAEPIAWLVRAIHDARWAAVLAASPRPAPATPDARALAGAFLAAFPASPHRASAVVIARGTAGGRFERAAPWMAALALVIATAGMLRSFGLLAPSGHAEVEPATGRKPAGEWDRERALLERLRALEGRTPRTVDDCDELLYGLSFLAEMAALDPGSGELAAARGRALDRVRALLPERERLVQLRRAQGVRDWTELVDVIDKLWGQGSQGAAHEKLRALRVEHWRAWSARTRDRYTDHRDVARILEAFVDRCRPLPHASALLAPELAEAQRFLADRWLWERLTTGGGFDGITVLEILVHRDCDAMRDSDGASQLAIYLGGVALTDYKDFPAREPDAEGWYRYDFTSYIGPLKFEVPLEGTDLAIVKRNWAWVNRTATARIQSPLELFAPLGTSTQTLEVAYEGNPHLRISLRFEAASRLVLAPLEGGQ